MVNTIHDITDKNYLRTLVCERYLNDPRYRQGHISIIAAAPGTEILGMHTPEMKAVARRLVCRDTWRDTLAGWAGHKPLTGEGGLCHEERMIWGLAICYAKAPLGERLALLDSFLPAIDNWAICDNLCCNSKWMAKADKNIVKPYLESLFRSGEEWRVRVAVILSMCHFLSGEDLDWTFSQLDALALPEGQPYYIRMGIAWLLATALAKAPDRTRGYLRTTTLPSDILRLYKRKARESRRTRETEAF